MSPAGLKPQMPLPAGEPVTAGGLADAEPHTGTMAAIDSRWKIEGNMMSNHSRYQQNIIRKYYENRDSIALQRAQELVTELYLSEGKKREKHWQSLALHLEKLGVRKPAIEHLREQDNPELVANLIKSLMSEPA